MECYIKLWLGSGCVEGGLIDFDLNVMMMIHDDIFNLQSANSTQHCFCAKENSALILVVEKERKIALILTIKHCVFMLSTIYSNATIIIISNHIVDFFGCRADRDFLDELCKIRIAGPTPTSFYQYTWNTMFHNRICSYLCWCLRDNTIMEILCYQKTSFYRHCSVHYHLSNSKIMESGRKNANVMLCNAGWMYSYLSILYTWVCSVKIFLGWLDTRIQIWFG